MMNDHGLDRNIWTTTTTTDPDPGNFHHPVEEDGGGGGKDPEIGTSTKRFGCMSRELLTCLALSSIVIGLPIAIIIMLFNLPRLSSQRDTRQQHYIMLAFGLPFTCVMTVAIIYGAYTLIQRIRRGSNPHHHQRRLRHHHHCHHHRPDPTKCCTDDGNDGHPTLQQQCLDISLNDDDDDGEEPETEPKLYSLVTQVMMTSKQQKLRNSSASVMDLSLIPPPSYDFNNLDFQNRRKSDLYLNVHNHYHHHYHEYFHPLQSPPPPPLLSSTREIRF